MRKQLVLSSLLAAVVAGCASKAPRGPTFHAGDERIPEFLNGPAVVLLTNASGYSAHLQTDIARPYAAGHPLSGVLLQRQGRLVFQPDQLNDKKHPGAGLIFIWDANLREGWTMSEALQGYAPVDANLSVTNVEMDASRAIPEVVDNHPCHRYEARLTRSDGSIALFRVWQADDLRHFPIRIQSESGGRPISLTLSNLRFDPPSQVLFNPPDGFVKYASPVALMNELIIRETTVGQPLEATEWVPPPRRGGDIMIPNPAGDPTY